MFLASTKALLDGFKIHWVILFSNSSSSNLYSSFFKRQTQSWVLIALYKLRPIPGPEISFEAQVSLDGVRAEHFKYFYFYFLNKSLKYPTYFSFRFSLFRGYLQIVKEFPKRQYWNSSTQSWGVITSVIYLYEAHHDFVVENPKEVPDECPKEEKYCQRKVHSKHKNSPGYLEYSFRLRWGKEKIIFFSLFSGSHIMVLFLGVDV